jgi:hypothetical protein
LCNFYFLYLFIGKTIKILRSKNSLDLQDGEWNFNDQYFNSKLFKKEKKTLHRKKIITVQQNISSGKKLFSFWECLACPFVRSFVRYSSQNLFPLKNHPFQNRMFNTSKKLSSILFYIKQWSRKDAWLKVKNNFILFQIWINN